MKRVGDLLSTFFEERFDKDTLINGRMTAGLFNSWATAVNAANISAAADHSRIRELEHKVIVIEAEHPGWVQILQTKQSQLLNYVQGKFPELDIQGISFCLSREPISPLVSVSDEPSQPFKENAISKTDTIADTEASADPEEEVNEALYEPIEKLKKVLRNRNR